MRHSNGLESFRKFVQKSASDWGEAKYFAPCAAFVQSSGTGKSRYVSEYGKSNWMIYACLRPGKSSGFPTRTPFIADFLTDIEVLRKQFNAKPTGLLFDIVLYCSYLAGSLRFLRHDFEAFAKNTNIRGTELYRQHVMRWHDLQFAYNKNVEFGRDILNHCRGILQGSLEKIHELQAPIGESCFHVGSLQLAFQCRALNKSLEIHGVESKSLSPVLFAFDEASALFENYQGRKKFHSLRYAMRMFPDARSSGRHGLLFFNVVLDTMDRFENFSPHNEPDEDPSLRFIVSTKLYDPYTTPFNCSSPSARNQ